MIKLNVWGGAGEHGRSAYLLSGSRQRLLLDCGVKKEGSGEYPLIEPEVVPQLDALLLSHAHEDHSAAIPLLYKLGYTGEVWTTRETKEQLTTYFKAWRRNMEHAGQPLPYGEADERLIRYRFLEDEAERECWFELLPGVSVIWGRSGHLAGSVWLGIEMEGKRILYSGDYTSESMLLQADDVNDGFQRADLERQHRTWAESIPISIGGTQGLQEKYNVADKKMIQQAAYVQAHALGATRAEEAMVDSSVGSLAASLGLKTESRLYPSVSTDDKAIADQRPRGERTKENTVIPSPTRVSLDLAIIDAAYGTDRDTQADKLQQLEHAISKALGCGGKVLLPMPAVGRGQELILWAQQCFPDMPLIVEQKLAEGMGQLNRAPFWLREQEGEILKRTPADSIARFLSGEGWERVGTTEERTRLLTKYEASLWFIPDGMMQSSLAQWYYKVWASDANNLILLTGHTSAGTFAYQLLETPEQYGVCRVEKVRYKVHQGWQNVEHMFNQISARHSVLVHTDLAETERLRQGLLGGLFRPEADIDLLSPGDELIF
ncbi:MBL fold metallo-hydrolase [Paenibacillus sp. AN1007]|uniref:MBL fold metallo-hydrolase n=1 Tax=Paenibacillus sp. AN1007 TaxID=3151385 RepID=A0AAU8NBV7_9BACL